MILQILTWFAEKCWDTYIDRDTYIVSGPSIFDRRINKSIVLLDDVDARTFRQSHFSVESETLGVRTFG